MEPTIFQAHPEIIEKMFDALDSNTLLNCRLVCKTWNQFLENPNIWLKKLEEIGQPAKVELAWKNLIAKSKDMEIERSTFAKCLRMKFTHFMRTHKNLSCDRPASCKNLSWPPIYTAAYIGSLEIVKLIYKLGENCNCRIYYVKPIFAAIDRGHNEVVKFLIENSQENLKLLYDANGNTPIMSAITNKNLDLVKFLMPQMPNLKVRNKQIYGAIHLAICDYEILKYLVSQPGVNPNFVNGQMKTALQMLCREDLTSKFKIPPGDIAKMIRILAPLADKAHFSANMLSETPLQIAAKFGSEEAIKALLEFFDPNEENKNGRLPIDFAISNHNIEAVKILAPLTKQLNETMSKHREYRKISNALDVVQSFIDEREGISKRKIDSDSHETCGKPAQKKIRLEPKVENLYELPYGDKFEKFTEEQINRMIDLFKQDQAQK